MQNDTYSATQDRQMIDALFSAAGILVTTDLAVSQRAAGANMSVDVAAGNCVVVGTDVTGQGKYLCKNTAVVNVSIAAAPSSGNSRIDLIVATVRDADADGGAHNDWIIQAVTGTAATTGTQVAPSAPVSSFILAQIAVGPTVTMILTANITDKRVMANKLQVPRVVAVTQSAIPAINSDIMDVAKITGLAQAVTSFTNGLTGSPIDWQKLMISIKDNGTARGLTWGTSFEASTTALPSTTVVSTTMDILFRWNADTSKYRILGVS